MKKINTLTLEEHTCISPRIGLHCIGIISSPTYIMHIILLKFTANQNQAPQFTDGHKQWLKRGFADGVFLLAGSLEPGLGGGILAHGCSTEELTQRVNDDPFVIENVVTAEVVELDPGLADERLQFLVS